MDPNLVLFGVAGGIAAVLFAIVLIFLVLRLPTGNARMREIAAAIQEGASAYLNRQYTVIAIIGVLIAVVIGFAINWTTAALYIVGAVLSAAAGYVGMNIAVRANVRTAEAARGGLNKARLGGGIYTKAADVGADLVGKVEAGIPEDDPRNPAVIADNVGDNVGDCAGMAADLFETYAVTMIAAMLLASLLFKGEIAWVIYPLLLGAVSVVGSIAGTFFVRVFNPRWIMGALYAGLLVAVAVAVVGFYLVTQYMRVNGYLQAGGGVSDPNNLFFAGLVGVIITVLIVAITEYFTETAYWPVHLIAKASVTGHATNIIAGQSIGMMATALPVTVIGIGILISYNLAGLYGIAIAAVSMLSMTGIIVAIDSYGPITDNALRHRLGRVGRAGPVLFLHPGAQPSRPLRGFRPPRPARHCRPFLRWHPSVPVRLAGDARRGKGRWPGGRGGPPPVPRDPGDFGGYREARVRDRGADRDRGRPAGDDPAGHHPGGRAAGRRLPARSGGSRRDADRRHRHRPVPRADDDEGRGGLGQREEVHRGRPPGWQGLRGTQGRRHRRYGRRPQQGHSGSRHQPHDQGRQHHRDPYRRGGGLELPDSLVRAPVDLSRGS